MYMGSSFECVSDGDALRWFMDIDHYHNTKTFSVVTSVDMPLSECN